MGRLSKFLQLSRSDQLLLFRALTAVISMRLFLWVLPFRVVHRLVRRRLAGFQWSSEEAAGESADRVVWAVTAASRIVPRATCLTQALAGQVLLARRGYQSRLRIGVARGGGSDFRAHAWLEYQDEVVIGGGNLDEFTPLPDVGNRWQ